MKHYFGTIVKIDPLGKTRGEVISRVNSILKNSSEVDVETITESNYVLQSTDRVLHNFSRVPKFYCEIEIVGSQTDASIKYQIDVYWAKEIMVYGSIFICLLVIFGVARTLNSDGQALICLLTLIFPILAYQEVRRHKRSGLLFTERLTKEIITAPNTH